MSKIPKMMSYKRSNCCKKVFYQLMLSLNAVNKELMCKICIKYEYVSRAVCAYAHDFQK